MESSNRAPAATGKSINDYYEIGSRLTQESVGANAEVLRGVRRSDGKHFAIKVLRVGHTREDRSQIRALQSVNHVGIIKLEDWFETSTSLYLVMELALGGELFTRIQHRGRLSEREAAAVVKQMLEAIGHMHSRGLVHCDLKPENILYADMSENSPLKIADFGFAQFLPGRLEKLKQTLGGTPSYTAPEILMGQPYDGKVDMWSLGVILYILLSGIKPFKVSGRTPEELRAAVSTVLRGEYTFVKPHFTNVSAEAKDLIARLLVVDPKQRLSWDQALAHRWITGLAQDTPLGAQYIEELSRFNQGRGLSSHALAGMVSRISQPDAIAAMSSADPASLACILQEGSIQPLISLSYSKSVDDCKNACNAMANLALKEEFQFKIVSEGGIRRLNEMAFEAATNEIKFFVALAMARIAKNPQLRLDMVLAEEGSLYKTHEALIRLALPPPQNSERVQTQAAEALGLLLLEENLHCTLVHAGVLPVIMRQANPSQQSDFRRTALHALRGLSIASLRNQVSGCVQTSQLESEICKIAEMAPADAALRLGLACFSLLLKKEKIDANWSTVSPSYNMMIEKISFNEDSKVRTGLKLPKLDPIDPLEVHEQQSHSHLHHSSSRKESERREEEELSAAGGVENGALEEEIQSCIQHLVEAQNLLHLVTGRSPPRTWLEDCNSLEAHGDPFSAPVREHLPDEVLLSEPYYQADVLDAGEGEENYLVQPSEEDRALLDSMLRQLALDRGIIADVLSRAKGARGADKAQKLIHAIGDTIQLIADTLGIHY